MNCCVLAGYVNPDIQAIDKPHFTPKLIGNPVILNRPTGLDVDVQIISAAIKYKPGPILTYVAVDEPVLRVNDPLVPAAKP
jgi:hypothetical protein